MTYAAAAAILGRLHSAATTPGDTMFETLPEDTLEALTIAIARLDSLTTPNPDGRPAGRPRLDGGDIRRSRSLSLSAMEWDKILEIGGGNRSEGVRRLLKG